MTHPPRDETRPRIRYDLRPTSLGRLLVAATPRGVCLIRFAERDAELVALLHEEFPCARPVRDREELAAWVDPLLRRIEGLPDAGNVPLDVRGSRFQRRVWAALCEIPSGETRSYGEIAARLDCPGGARAVGRACATNPVPVAVPCHRAVRADGGLGGFLGGLARKRALLANERRGGVRRVTPRPARAAGAR